jgi:predicted DNA-binding transcriptional regulator AlpA
MESLEKDSSGNSTLTSSEVLSPEDLLDLFKKALNEVFPDAKPLADQLHISRPLTEGEAAELIGVKPQTMAVWRSKGTGPPYLKTGRSIRYRPEDIKEYLQQHLVRTSN